MYNKIATIIVYEYEKSILVNALNNLRTSQIINNEDTEMVDSLILKIINAPVKKNKKLKLLEAR